MKLSRIHRREIESAREAANEALGIGLGVGDGSDDGERQQRDGEQVPRLLFAAARTPPMPMRLLKLAEAHW